MNITQFTTLKNAITDYIDSIVETIEPKRAVRLFELLVDSNISQENLEQRFQDIIGSRNQQYDELLLLRKVYLLQIDLNLDHQGEQVTLEDLQKEFKSIIDVYVKDIQTDIQVGEDLTKLALEQVKVIKSYVNKKFEAREEFMKLDLVKEQALTNSKVTDLDTKVDGIVDYIKEKLVPSIKNMQKNMEENRQENHERQDLVLDLLRSIQSRLDSLENPNVNQQRQGESSTSSPKGPNFF